MTNYLDRIATPALSLEVRAAGGELGARGEFLTNQISL